MAHKGFNSSIAVYPETKGWGSTAHTEGHYLYVDSISLSPNQEFKDHPDKIVYGRGEKASARTVGPQKPGGDIEWQFRANDCIPTFMAFFQKYIGTQLGSTGTSIYTFVPEKGVPDSVGSTFGTGSYTSPAGDLFTVGVLEKINDTGAGVDDAMVYSSGIVDQLVFNIPADDDAKVTPTFKFGALDAGTKITVNPNNAVFGSYSTLNPFDGFEGTFSVGGNSSLDIMNITLTMQNQTDDLTVLGKLNPSSYDMGKTKFTGVVQVAAPTDSLAHLGSMLDDRAFSISGTLFNSLNNQVTYTLPNCKYDPFEVNPTGANAITEYGIPFTAYESENGVTPPITVTVRTTGMGSAFTVV